MFGYVRVFQPELKMREWEQYRGVYCSLCRTLGKRYGVAARFLLNYDLTCLSLFHMALTPQCVGFSSGRCALNPLKKCRYCQENAALDLAADAAVFLTFYKLRDTVVDDGFFRRLAARLACLPVGRMKRRATRNRPELAEAMAAYAAAQRQVEQVESSPDAAAEPTAQLMAWLTATGVTEPEEREAAARFGYCLGRWIYFIDAADDWAEDTAHGRFNPFAPALERPQARMEAALNMCQAECLASWHRLPRYQFDSLVQNILCDGMPAVQRQVFSEKKGSRR